MGAAHSLAYSNVARLYYPALPNVEKVRLADISLELAHAGAARHGWRESTADWRDITRAPDIDIVDIVTPNATHSEIAVDAAAHGKHVFCEKPLADSTHAARAMLDAASTAGITHQIGFVYRTWPAVALARDFIVAGDIGEVLQVNVRYRGDYGFADRGRVGWRFQKTGDGGGGSLADIGSHAIDVARYLAGEIRRVCANARVFEDDVASSQATRSPTARSREQAVDDDAIDVLIDFESGALGVIQTSWCAAGRKNDLEFEVYGDKGSLGFSWPHANELLYFSRLDAGGREGSRRLIIGPEHPGAAEFWPVAGLGLGYSDAFLIALGRFVRSVATGGDASPNFLEGLRACEVTDAIRASAEAGAWKHVQREPRTARGA